MDFQGKVVVVTGAASGIGQACVHGFAARNATVAMVDRKPVTERELGGYRQHGGHVEFFPADVSSRPAVENVVAEITQRFGRIDVLVNNAGIQRYATVTSASEEEWDEVMNVNLKSAFLMAKYCIPHMLEVGGGSIVTTGSVQSLTAQRNSVHYVASKHALLGLTRSIALDFGKQNIRANCVLPGAIDTPMLRWAASLGADPQGVLDAIDKIHIRGKMGRPEEVANVIVFLSSDMASLVTGSAVVVDGGLLVPAGGMAFQEVGTGAIKA